MKFKMYECDSKRYVVLTAIAMARSGVSLYLRDIDDEEGWIITRTMPLSTYASLPEVEFVEVKR